MAKKVGFIVSLSFFSTGSTLKTITLSVFPTFSFLFTVVLFGMSAVL